MKKTFIILTNAAYCIGLFNANFQIVKADEHRSGCCSHHSGVCGCSMGQTVCCDGWISSCGC